LHQEADQSPDVLRSRCQEELLTNKLQPPQAQATHSHAMLQFREQCFYLLSRPLGASERRRVRQFSRPLPGRLVPVNGEIFISTTNAVRS